MSCTIKFNSDGKINTVLNPDGTESSEVVDLEGNAIPLSSPEDLWELVKITQEKVGKAKKK